MKTKRRGDQLILLGILLIGLAGALYLQVPQLAEWIGARERVAAAPPPATPGTSVAQAPQAEPQKPVEEVQESPDTETTLERFIPRSSVGHAQGLHKVADPLHLGASAAIVVDAQTKEPLFGKNPDSELPMASITKLMTGLVTLESRLSMDDPITITEDDVDHVRNSRSRMRVGSVLTRGEALRLALMSSENRAAHALGRTYPGGLPAFVEAMNRKARQLGMTHTQYVEPTGLSEKNHSTARDLATLVLAASSFPLLREFSTTPEHRTTLGSRVLLYRNSDPLIRDPGWDIVLQKTGYIIEAGHCVVLRTKVDARDVVIVVLDAGDNRTRSTDARRMHAWVAAGANDAAYRIALNPPRQVRAAPAPTKHAVAARDKPDKSATSKSAKKEKPKSKAAEKATASAKSKSATKSARAARRETQQAKATPKQGQKKARVRVEFREQQAHDKAKDKDKGSQG